MSKNTINYVPANGGGISGWCARCHSYRGVTITGGFMRCMQCNHNLGNPIGTMDRFDWVDIMEHSIVGPTIIEYISKLKII